MHRSFFITLLGLAIVLAAGLFVNISAEDKVAKPSDADAGIEVSELDEHGLVTKVRPILPKISTGDPLRFALHFEMKDGPLEMSHEKLGQQLLDRTGTLDSIELAIRTPGEKWQVLKGDIGKENPRKTMLYSNATFLLEVKDNGLALLNTNGSQELLLPWKWKNPGIPGEYSFAVRGTLKLSTNERVVRERGKPPKKLPATKMDVEFQSKPISITVVRADMTEQTLADLSKQAVEAVRDHKSIKAEKLTVVGVEGLPIADANGNRVIRVKATIPKPKPPAGGGVVIAIAGGTGYWQYEVVMSSGGMPISFGRARKGFCVVQGTQIATPDDDVPVEQLFSGQQVWAYDSESQTKVPATVRAVLAAEAREVVAINDRLRVTAEHPIAVLKNGTAAWQPAAALSKGDVLLSFDGKPTPVASVEIESGKFEVFDVAVDGPHNFFAAGLLVHNKSIAWTPKAFVPWYALWNRAPKLK